MQAGLIPRVVKNGLPIEPPGGLLAVGEKVKFPQAVGSARDDFQRGTEGRGEVRARLPGVDAFDHLSGDAVVERGFGHEQLRRAADGHHRDIVARLQIVNDRQRLFFGRLQTGGAVDPARHAHRVVDREDNGSRHIAAENLRGFGGKDRARGGQRQEGKEQAPEKKEKDIFNPRTAARFCGRELQKPERAEADLYHAAAPPEMDDDRDGQRAQTVKHSRGEKPHQIDILRRSVRYCAMKSSKLSPVETSR